MPASCRLRLFFFNDTATTEIYTLSLHDALPIYWRLRTRQARRCSGNGSSSSRRSRSEEHTSELQSQFHLVCRLLLEKKNSTPDVWHDDDIAALLDVAREHRHEGPRLPVERDLR